jgi:glycosyltransferase involved in cell wall biosynthesis
VRVVLDATAIPADLGGVGRYVAELGPRLVDEGVDLTIACQQHAAATFAARVPGAEVVPTAGASAGRAARLAWEQTGLPRLVRAVRADVLHSPHYTMPFAVDAARVVTLHDATFFSSPEVHGRLKRRFFRSAIRYAVAHADALVAPSAATSTEVLRFTGGDPGLFHVAYHGVDRATFHAVEPIERARVAASLGLGDQPYIAFLGTLEPRKNVPALVRGWVEAAGALGEPPALVLAGGPGWDRAIEPAVAAVPAGLRVLRPGYLPVDDLAGYLAGAVLVAYPSLGEGFGLPVLEAMACGAAVLTSRELSLPEVGGDAAEYCGTSDVEIGAALTSLLQDSDRRAQLSTLGVDRAAEFTWERSARAHLVAYEAALRHRATRRSRTAPGTSVSDAPAPGA